MIAPKPTSRGRRTSLWRYLQMFRRDILSAQPGHLYGAWMAEFRTPFFRSYMVNDPEVLHEILQGCPQNFPKSDRVGEGLRPLLGQSVFLTNDEVWRAQRRIIDPAFEGGRLRETFPAMEAAVQAGVARLAAQAGDAPIEIEALCSHIAADIIFRTMFSIPIEDALAAQVYHEFQTYQRSQPLLNLAAFVPLPRWMPRFRRRATRASARRLRGLIRQLVQARVQQIAEGTAPPDLATKIMTTPDPQTGACFEPDEMVDQVAIFFLAGHETSASALAWALYLIAAQPIWQDRLADEAAQAEGTGFSDVSRLRVARDVFRETLRLYPPVPMMVRQARCPVTFRKRDIPSGALMVLSPWHLQRHTRIWSDPDSFDPARWNKPDTREAARTAYMPFSAGPRVCPGAGFAMIEGPLALSRLASAFRFEPDQTRVPVPVAHLTVRSDRGIWLRVTPRAG